MDENTFEKSLAKSFFLNQKRDRRWKNIRFLLGFIMFVYFIVVMTSPDLIFSSTVEKKGDYVSLVRMNGMIMAGKSFSAKNVIPLLVSAFKDKEAKGVVLDINSGGGSAVQSSIIYERIMALKQEYPNKKVIVVAEDMLASGAYLVALAADKIYVNPNTIAGSIGVISKGFGLKGAIDKLGITRRVFTAGKNKDRLDPFEEVTKEDTAKLQDLLTEIHTYFVGLVKTARKGKLKGDPDLLFSGDFWTGNKAVTLGLVDGTETLASALKKEFNVKRYRSYQTTPSFIKEIVKNMGVELNHYLVPHSAALAEIY